MSKAKPGATISLFGIFGGNEEKDEPSPAATKSVSETPPQTGLSRAPKDVPTISKWEKNSDNSVTGFIKGSFSFGEGEAVTTSPIRGTIAGGSVVETASGSRYFLAPMKETSTPSKRAAPKKAPVPKKAPAVKKAPVAKKAPPPKRAPRGVPSLVNWRKNRDGSVTGFITGSPNFEEGEKITTSPIASGEISDGNVVQTGSGSKYFLV